jgi:hypothetical protein
MHAAVFSRQQARCEIYVCGSVKMVQAMWPVFIAYGLDPERATRLAFLRAGLQA